MMTQTLVLATTLGKVSLQDIHEHLAGFDAIGIALSSLAGFWLLLLQSIGVLVVARWARWPLSHLSLPVLAWSFRATWLQTQSFEGGGQSHAVFFVSGFLEAGVALVFVVAILALAVAFRADLQASRLDQLSWLSGLLAVATVIVDWTFLALFVVPWPES